MASHRTRPPFCYALLWIGLPLYVAAVWIVRRLQRLREWKQWRYSQASAKQRRCATP